MSIHAGKLNERVTLRAPSVDRDQFGEATLDFDDIATVWAQVDGLSSREILQAMQANVVASHRIRIRFRGDLTPHCRIIWRDRTMEVSSLVERQSRTMLEMLVREVQ